MKYRFILTEKCQADCPHCFNASYRKTGEMAPGKLLQFLEFNKKYIGRESRAFLMGGEPTLHPDINSLIDIFQRHFRYISLFSNGIDLHRHTDNLSLRKHDSIIFNGFTFNPEKLKPFFLNPANEFTKAIHFVFTLDGHERMMAKLRNTVETYGLRDDLKIAISPDTNVNIYNKEIKTHYQEIWSKVLLEVKQYLPGYLIDHPLPWCFYDNPELVFLATYSNIGGAVRNAFCGSGSYNSCAGLVTTNFDLYFCNQTWMKLGNIFHKNGEPLSLFEVNTLIDEGVRKKVTALKDGHPECRDCKVLELCKGRCFAYKFINSKGDGNESGTPVRAACQNPL
ncbi:MAG: radical SAM/SPASM domain-containing protein [Elusimicrobiales bacterium]